jgi:hypothetical protein
MNALTQDRTMNTLRRNAMKALTKIGLAAALAALLGTAARAGTVNLDWDEPNPETNVAGYTVFHTAVPTDLTDAENNYFASTTTAMGNAAITKVTTGITVFPSSATFTAVLPSNTYYFQVTARNSSNGHSFFSFLQDPSAPLAVPGREDAGFRAVQFFVPNGAPTVSFSNVTAGRNFRINLSTTVTVNASDPDGTIQSVRLLYNSSLVGSDGTSPYAIPWTVPGTAITGQTLEVVAIDNNNAYSTHTLSVNIVDNTPPIVNFTNVTAGRNFQVGIATNVTTSASDPDGTITGGGLLVNGTRLGSIVAGAGPFSFAWTPSAEGAHTLGAEARDNDTWSSTNTISVNVINTPPTVNVTNVTAGRQFRVGTSTSIAGSASDAHGIDEVRLRYNNQQLAVIDNPGATFSFPYTFSIGEVATNAQLQIVAIDNRGLFSTATVSNVSVVDNAAPVANLTSVVRGGITLVSHSTVPAWGSAVTVSGTASDDISVNRVHLLDNGVVVSTVNAPAASFSFASYAPISVGEHVLTVRAVDGQGLFGSPSVPFSLFVRANQAPVISNLSAQTVLMSGGAALNPTVTDADGGPNTLTYLWERNGGSAGGSVSFANAGARQTTASFSSAGDYILRLTVSDGSTQAQQNVTITVGSLDLGVAFSTGDANQVVLAVRSSFFSGPSGYVRVDLPVGTDPTVTLAQVGGSDLYVGRVAASSFGSYLDSLFTGGLTVSTAASGGSVFSPQTQTNRVIPSLGALIKETPSSNTGAQVILMPGSVSQEASLGIAPLADDSRRNAALKRQNLRAIGAARDFTLSNGSLIGVANLRLPYDNSLVPRGVPPSNVKMGYYNPATDTWELQDVTMASGAVQCDVSHFSIYMPVLFQPPAGLKEAFSYPNPAVGVNPTIRATMGTVESVEITIFDITGQVIHSATIPGTPSGTTPAGEYYYDYVWRDAKASGTYNAVIHGKTADNKTIRARTRFAVVK